jgi:hypothetical protein
VLAPIENAAGSGAYALEWSAVAGAEQYRLEESWEEGPWAMLYIGPATRYDTTRRPAGHYAYRVLAERGPEFSPWSNIETTDVIGAQPNDLRPPDPEPVAADGQAVLRVINDTRHPLWIELAGPQPTTLTLPACDICAPYFLEGPDTCPTEGRPADEAYLTPGDYRLFARVDTADVKPLAGYWTLEPDQRYRVCFFVVRIAPSGRALTFEP